MYVTRDLIKKPFIKKGFNINAMRKYLAEREGFEPSKGFLNPYSLSRGAPSATRPPLLIKYIFNRFLKCKKPGCGSIPVH
jgi:hypothetical protein